MVIVCPSGIIRRFHLAVAMSQLTDAMIGGFESL